MWEQMIETGAAKAEGNITEDCLAERQNWIAMRGPWEQKMAA
jgi:hypothetical protein